MLFEEATSSAHPHRRRICARRSRASRTWSASIRSRRSSFASPFAATHAAEPCIDELEVFTATAARNAVASLGAKATASGTLTSGNANPPARAPQRRPLRQRSTVGFPTRGATAGCSSNSRKPERIDRVRLEPRPRRRRRATRTASPRAIASSRLARRHDVAASSPHRGSAGQTLRARTPVTSISALGGLPAERKPAKSTSSAEAARARL